MKKLIALLLTFAMLLPLAACGGAADPNAGKYIGVSAAVGGFSKPMSDIYEGEGWIELKSGGKLKMNLMGEEYSGKWELDGQDLTVTQAGDPCHLQEYS